MAPSTTIQAAAARALRHVADDTGERGMDHMAEEFLADMLKGEEPVAEPALEPEAQVETPPEPAPEPGTETPPEPMPEAPAPQNERTVPLATFLDQRDELRQLKQWKQETEARERQVDAPDPLDDPIAFVAAQRQEVQQALFAERWNNSEYLATEKFGGEAVKAAADWAEDVAKRDPTFAQRFASERFPMMWIVQQHKRDAMLSEIGDRSVDDFVRDYLTRNPTLLPQSAPVAATPVVASQQQAVKPPAPPRSIASERSDAPVVTAQGDRDGFLASFK